MDMHRNLLALIQLKREGRRRFANSNQRSAGKVAYQYLKRALAGDDLYDLTGRMIILEGAAGVQPFTWARNPTRGVAKAQEFLAAHLDEMEPEWLQPKSTRAVTGLTRSLDSMLSRSGVSELGGEDLIQYALAGIGIKSVDQNGEVQLTKVKNKFWEAGKLLSDRILNGKETPGSVLAGILGKALRKSALTAINKLRRHQEAQGGSINVGPGAGDEDAFRGVADPSAGSSSVFTGIFFSDDPLGVAARKAILQIIQTKLKPAYQPTMLAWWEGLNNGRMLKGKELALAAGYPDEKSSQVKVKKHMNASLPVIFQEMQKNTRLQNAMAARLRAQGVEVGDISWSDIEQNPQSYGRYQRYASLRNQLALLQAEITSPRS